MAETAIEWATHVWNPFTGCDRVSPGCAHCYAIPTAAANQRRELGRGRVATERGRPLPMMRYQNDGDPKTSGPGFGFTVHWDKLERPERFPTGARVFVNSMSDVFHEDAPPQAIRELFEVCRDRPDVSFLMLTKRAERMHQLLNNWANATGTITPVFTAPPNVWLGVTIENRRFVHRADILRRTPAAVRFISAEPLLGPLLPDADYMIDADGDTHPVGDADFRAWRPWADDYEGSGLDLEGIDWLIVGGESGAGHRPIREEWVRALKDYCETECWQGEREGHTAFFFKQWGGRTPKSGGRELDGRTWDEMPERTAAVA